MSKLTGAALAAALMFTTACGSGDDGSAATPAPSPSERSEVGKRYDQMVKEKDAEKAAAATKAEDAAAAGNEPAYLASVNRHLAGTVLEGVDRVTLVELGRSTCEAFENGSTPNDILANKALPARPARALIADSATHLCPEQPVALPKLLPKPKPFPPGYPKVVEVSSMPYQPRSGYEGTYSKAVAVAPGVWTALPPGATVQDATDSGILDGFCGSIKAYERKFTPGVEHGGTCW